MAKKPTSNTSTTEEKDNTTAPASTPTTAKKEKKRRPRKHRVFPLLTQDQLGTKLIEIGSTLSGPVKGFEDIDAKILSTKVGEIEAYLAYIDNTKAKYIDKKTQKEERKAKARQATLDKLEQRKRELAEQEEAIRTGKPLPKKEKKAKGEPKA